ncbi:MAG: xanthine dehydrogenase family protein molybdopterin-binding subunit [Thermoanaerobacteraceae bacterium]|nr:xanthine dehydrogenase family protein molybdopterin-binding subunit [Thermoanaerobacteraceae bacterium]
MDIIGSSVHRIESVEKVTGEARYTHDIKMEGMLYARILTSPYPHAKILSIDTSRAKELPGVFAVLTGEEIPYKVGLYMVDKPVLAQGKARYQGEPVAAVAAVTEEIAREAVKLIRVEYEPVQPVFDPVEALKPDAPLVHEKLGEYSYVKGVFFPEPGTNVASHIKIRKGNVFEGFAKADRIIENDFYLPQVNHVPLETHSSIARWGKNGEIEIWTSAQSPFAVRNLLSVSLGISPAKIRVHVPYVGGGFGGKAGIHLEPLVACLSKAADNRPVKIVATREEEFNTLPVRQGLKAHIKTGVTKEGRIVAEEINYYWDAGSYADYGVNIGRAGAYAGAGPYDIDNVSIDSYTIYTNHVFGTAYRGFGHLEVLWAIERQMDIAAHELGMDPYDFRMKNLLRPGSITITGEKINENTGSVIKCLEAAAKEIGWGKPKTEEELEEEKNTGRVRGKGLAVLHKAPAMPTNTGCAAILKFNDDGTINLLVSGVDYGQGTYTTLAMVAAEQMKMPVEKIKVVYDNDTDMMPYDWQTVASRFTFMGGNAVIRAADDLINQMKDVASRVLRAPKEELEIGNERIYIKHNPDEYLTYRQVALGYTYPNGNAIGGPLIGRGMYIAQGLTNLDPKTGQGLPAIDWTYGAHGVEIEIDTNTGDIRVLKIVSAFDVGKVLNKELCEEQVVGGVLQGLGAAICEQYLYRDGVLLTRTFTDYKVPTSMDVPDEIFPIFIETPQLDGPFGARGVAEHPMISVPSAIGNAVYNATGVNIYEVPMTPEKVYFALKNRA